MTSLVNGAADGVVGLGRRDDPLGARELHAGVEAGGLVIGLGLDQAELLHMADHRRHAVIAQPAGVEAGRRESGAQRVHLGERREVRGVAEIVGVAALGERRAGGGFDGDESPFPAAAQLRAEERK